MTRTTRLLVCALGWAASMGCGESFSASTGAGGSGLGGSSASVGGSSTGATSAGGGQGGTGQGVTAASVGSGGASVGSGGASVGGGTASVGGGTASVGGGTASVGGGGPGGGDTGGASGGAGQGGGPVGCNGGSGCADCLSNECPMRAGACASNAACGELVCCIAGCEMMLGCIGECHQMHPGGYADARLLGDCANAACANVCPVKADLTDCQVCTLLHCEQASNDCHADVACRNVYNCLQTCPNVLDCGMCGEGAPQVSKILASTLQTCRKSMCAQFEGAGCVLP